MTNTPPDLLAGFIYPLVIKQSVTFTIHLAGNRHGTVYHDLPTLKQDIISTGASLVSGPDAEGSIQVTYDWRQYETVSQDLGARLQAIANRDYKRKLREILNTLEID